MISKRNYSVFFAILMSFGSVGSANEQGAVKVITDPSRNLSIQLENINGKTKLTDIATGEVVTWLEGEQAEYWTDEEYKLMLDKEEVQKRLDFLIETSLNSNKTNKLKKSILTDSEKGLSVQLENENGFTKITDLSGQDPSFYIDGELAGVLTNADYKKMLDIEQDEKRLYPQKDNKQTKNLKANYSGTFNLIVKFTSASIYKATSTQLSASLSNVKMSMNATMTMQLCRDLTAWPDTCYALRSKPMYASMTNSFSTTWSGSFPAGNYYLIIGKTNNGDYAKGSFYF